MSWLDYIIVSLVGLGLIWLFFIVVVNFFAMMKDVDD